MSPLWRHRIFEWAGIALGAIGVLVLIEVVLPDSLAGVVRTVSLLVWLSIGAGLERKRREESRNNKPSRDDVV